MRRWVVEDQIGRGGMGVVFRARDPGTGQIGALKRMSSAAPDLLARFEREARAAHAISHRNVVKLLDWGQEQGAPCLVFELVEGGNLAERVHREGPLPWRDAVSLAADVARGLQAVHEVGLVHRDVKPANVLLSKDGAKLSDLGLVRRTEDEGHTRLTETGVLVGTPEFIAPEQIEGEPVSAQTDLYGLGATLFFALAGVPMFEGNPIAVLKKQLEERPIAPSRLAKGLPREVDRLVLRLLEKEPGARGASAAAVARELDALSAPRARGIARLFVALVVLALLAGVAIAAALDRGRGPAPVATAAPVVPAPPTAPDRSGAGPWFQGLRARTDALEKAEPAARGPLANELTEPVVNTLAQVEAGGLAPADRAVALDCMARFTDLWLAREDATPEDSDLADQLAPELVKLDPANRVRHLALRARILFRRQRYTEVLAASDELAKTGPLPPALRRVRALALAACGRREEALREARALGEPGLETRVLANADCYAFTLEAEALLKSGDNAGTLEALDRALAAKEDEGDTRTMRGSVRTQLGDREGAIEDYTRAYESRSRNAVLAIGNRGTLQKDRAMKLADYASAIRLDPNYEQAYRNRADLRLTMKVDLDDALEDLEKAAALGKEHGRTAAWREQVDALLEKARRLVDEEGR